MRNVERNLELERQRQRGSDRFGAQTAARYRDPMEVYLDVCKKYTCTHEQQESACLCEGELPRLQEYRMGLG